MRRILMAMVALLALATAAWAVPVVYELPTPGVV